VTDGDLCKDGKIKPMEAESSIKLSSLKVFGYVVRQVMVTQERVTLEDFKQFVSQDENADRLFELINGRIVEVSPGRTRNSEYGHVLAFAVRLFCREHHLPCHTSGEQGAYAIQGHVLAPDFAYKETPMSQDYPDPVPPKWAVEMISPTDKAKEIREKREVYQRAGILLWEMYAELERIDVYPPGKPPKQLGIGDVLDGGDVLPGFQITVRELLEE
jgi:Uma2 family endonuclease